MSRRQFKIGIMLDNLKLPVDQAVTAAARLGAEGVQIYCVAGEMYPENFAPPRRKELLKRMRDLGLKISAFCGELGGFVVDRPEAQRRVNETHKFLELCADMKVKILTSHVGVLSGQATDRVDACRWALEAIGTRAQELRVTFASETGAEPAEELRKFLDDLGQGAIGVNYDPANLVMQGWDHLEGVELLAKYIVHTHAKDGLFGQHKEVPLGQGDVDFPRWIENLNGIGYKGFLTIEREVGADPIADISAAVEFLKSLRTGTP